MDIISFKICARIKTKWVFGKGLWCFVCILQLPVHLGVDILGLSRQLPQLQRYFPFSFNSHWTWEKKIRWCWHSLVQDIVQAQTEIRIFWSVTTLRGLKGYPLSSADFSGCKPPGNYATSYFFWKGREADILFFFFLNGVKCLLWSFLTDKKWEPQMIPPKRIRKDICDSVFQFSYSSFQPGSIHLSYNIDCHEWLSSGEPSYCHFRVVLPFKISP